MSSGPQPVSVAVVGAGRISQEVHMPVLARLRREGLISLSCVCDLDGSAAQTAARKFGFARTTQASADVCADSAIEAVYVLGPAPLHYECARDALSAGKHVFVEKPPAENVAQLREVAALCQANGKVYAVGFNRRYQPAILEVRRQLETLGAPTMIEAAFHKPFMGQAVRYGGRSWLGSIAIHAVDILSFLFDDLPVELHAFNNRVTGEAPENFSAVLRWENGGHATLASSNTAGERLERYAIHGPGASFYCDREQLLSRVHGKKGKRSFGKSHEARGFLGEHRAFLAAIRDGEPYSNDVRAAIVATHLVTLAEDSYSGPLDWEQVLPAWEPGRAELASVSVAVPQSLPLRRTAGAADAKPVILVMAEELVAEQMPALTKRHRVRCPHTLTDAEKSAVVAAITGKGAGPIERELLAELPNLATVGVIGASVRRYDPQAVLGRNVPIINAADVYADAVAEFALLMAMVGIRNASRSHDAMRSGGWGLDAGGAAGVAARILLKRLWKRVKKLGLINTKKKGAKAGKGPQRGRGGARNFAGVSVGLFGWGQIARKFALLLKPFGCDVRVYSSHVSDDDLGRYGVRRAKLPELLEADVVSLHRAVTDKTRGSFGKREIEALKPGAVLINTARAALLDNEALLERLRRGDLFACLDVFDEEPLPVGSPLRKLPNVFLTAHISGSTDEVYRRSAEAVVEKVLAYLDGEEVASIITTPEMLANVS